MNERALAKLSNYSKEFVDAYLFTKLLTQFARHPVLFNFKANSNAYRLRLGYGRDKYQKLLKLAVAHRLVVLNGDNLHLVSHTQERKLFNLKSNHQTEISASELKQFAHAQIIIRNIKSQEHVLAKSKGSSTGFTSSPHHVLNQSPVLSCRKAGMLLHLSHTRATLLLTKLKTFGLTVIKNTVQIPREQYQQLRLTHPFNVRYNAGQFLFVGANRVDFTKPAVCKHIGYSYCSNDI